MNERSDYNAFIERLKKVMMNLGLNQLKNVMQIILELQEKTLTI